MQRKLSGVIRNHWPLLLLLVLGAVLRWINLFASMSFFYDQARDALIVQKILSGRPVLVGPSADTTGLFMGPLWYYFLTPLYFFASGHPGIVLLLVSFIDLATIILLYYLVSKLFTRKTAIVASAIWALGALPVAYARTLSNPSTTAFWSLFLFLSLIKVAENKLRYLLLAAISLAVLFQFNLATAYLLAPYVFLVLLILRTKLQDRKIIFGAGLIFLLSFVPQVVFEIRNHFPSLVRLQVLFFSAHPTEGFFYGLWLRLENFRDELSNYTFYGSRELAVIFFLTSIFIYFKTKTTQKKLFLLWLIIPLLTYFFLYFRGEAHPHYLLGWIPAAVILLANLLVYLGTKFWPATILVLAVFILTTSTGLRQEIFLKKHIAQPADPNPTGLADEIQVVDYMCRNADGQAFGYHNYSIVPYFEDSEWQYLFSWYGQKKYGYVPSRRAGNPLYLIYEPDPYLPDFCDRWLTAFRSPDKGPVVVKVQISAYTIEKFDKNAIR